MDGNDFNLITPISSLQGLSRMSDVDRRKERKRKGKQKRDSESQQQDAPEPTDELVPEVVEDSENSNRLDFRA